MEIKKILIVGVLDVPGSTNIAMKKGFEGLGCEVDEYNYRTVAGALGSFENMNKHFWMTVKDGKWDLIVFCKVNGMDPTLLDFAKTVCPTWYWFMDPMETAILIGASKYAANATFASATASDVTWRFSMINKNAYHMIEGYDPDIYYYEELRKIHNVLFIGNATAKRVRDLTVLGVGNISIFGKGWPDGWASAPVINGDERTEINQAKWVLNLAHDDVIFSDRVIKALGCGANVISQKTKDLLMYNGYVKTFNTPNEFYNIINKLGCNIQYRIELANTIKENYSWQAVCADMIETVKEKMEC